MPVKNDTPNRKTFNGLVFSGILAVSSLVPGIAKADFLQSFTVGFPVSTSTSSVVGAIVRNNMDSSQEMRNEYVEVEDLFPHESGIQQNVKSVEIRKFYEGIGQPLTPVRIVVSPTDPKLPIKLGLSLGHLDVTISDKGKFSAVKREFNQDAGLLNFSGNVSNGLVMEIFYKSPVNDGDRLRAVVSMYDTPSFKALEEQRLESKADDERNLLIGLTAGVGLLGFAVVRNSKRN